MEIFNAKRKSFEYRQLYNGTREKVFPLLCYKKEYEWIPGWQAIQVFSNSGYMEEGCAFISYLRDLPEWSHIGKTAEMNWFVHAYDKENYYIESANFVKDAFILKFSIRLIEEEKGKTTAVFSHMYTGLTEGGNKLIDKVINEEYYVKGQQFLEKCMNYFLDNGKIIKL
jgi:hypothetical protein